MQIGGVNFNRVNRNMPCPLCGKEKWCMVSDDGSQVICPRTDLGAMKELTCGFLHELGDERPKVPKYKITKTRLYKPDYKYIAEYYNWLDTDTSHAAKLAQILGVTPRSLLLLGLAKGENCWAFPMFDENRRIVGIKRRFPDNQKRSVRHSKLGVYFPLNFNKEVTAVICEGESDTAAMLSLGLNAIGRASANSCEDILARLIGNQDAVIIADDDKDGIRFAYKLKAKLPNSCVIVSRYGDARGWYNSGNFDFNDYHNMIKTAKLENEMFSRKERVS